MSNEQNLTEEEIATRFKQANAQGFINQMIAGSGATAEQATELFKKSNAKADKLLKKAQTIRESILAEVADKQSEDLSKSAGNLPENLRAAAQS
jgi:hypothetical protein